MNPFDLGIRIERAYRRDVLLAVELIDAVTLERVGDGIEVKVDGLTRKPARKSGGLFVWLREGGAQPVGIEVDPGSRPYQAVTCDASRIKLPLTRVELAPRRGYPFSSGVTAVSGMLVETRATPPAPAVPIADAEAWLRWLDEDTVTWRDAPVVSRTDDAGGFVALLRLAPSDRAHVDNAGAVTVHLRARRAGGNDLGSLPFSLPQGRVADALPPFAWDEFQP